MVLLLVAAIFFCCCLFPFRKNKHSTWNSGFGRWVSFWEGFLAGAMLISVGRGCIAHRIHTWILWVRLRSHVFFRGPLSLGAGVLNNKKTRCNFFVFGGTKWIHVDGLEILHPLIVESNRYLQYSQCMVVGDFWTINSMTDIQHLLVKFGELFCLLFVLEVCGSPRAKSKIKTSAQSTSKNLMRVDHEHMRRISTGAWRA